MKDPIAASLLSGLDTDPSLASTDEPSGRGLTPVLHRLQREKDELQRRNEQLVETFLFLQDKLDDLKNQLSTLEVEKAKLESRLEESAALHDKLDHENQNLRKRLNKAVEVIALERGKNPIKKLLGR